MKNLYVLIIIFCPFLSVAQVGIGTPTPDASSILHISSDDKGVLIPRMTESQRVAIINPAQGLLVFQTTEPSNFYYFDGVIWTIFNSANTWNIDGNSNTDPAVNFIGTTDDASLIIATNNKKAIQLTEEGKVSIGTNDPEAVLHIESDPLILIEDGFEDATIAPFTTSGDLDWEITSNAVDVFAGSTAVRSDPALANNQISDLEITKTATSVSVIKFQARVSTELNFDRFLFLIDGEPVLDLSGVLPFTQYSFAVLPGSHVFTWRYIKDFSIDANDDLVAIDDIKFIESNPVLQIEDGTEQEGFVLTSDNLGNTSWTDPTLTQSPDQDWLFISGDQNIDPIYRTGSVRIGDIRAPRYLLDVHFGRLEGSQLGIGSTEFVADGLSEFQFSNSIVPLIDNSLTLGRSARRWSEIFTVSGVITTSDRRLKTAIQPISNSSDHLSQIETASYYWKKETHGDLILKGDQRTRKIGFLAHNLLKVLPTSVADTEWVSIENSSDYRLQPVANLGVYYQQITPVIVGSIQEDQERLIQIKKDQSIIEDLINQLKN